MSRSWLATVTAGLGLVLGWWLFPAAARAQGEAPVQWIWFDAGDPAQKAPAETVYFRKVFAIDRPVEKPVDEAVLDITADDSFQVWVNGTLVGKGDTWKRVYAFDVAKLLVHGKNVIAVEAVNAKAGSAGLLARLGYVPNGQSKLALVSDGSWKASKAAGAGWQKADFDDAKWTAARVLGAAGTAAPWKNSPRWDSGGDDRFTVPPGFKVELAVKIPANDAKFSLVNMCFDAKGRLLVSREGGPILLCTAPNKAGVLQDVSVYCDQVKNCQGMCWVKDALLLVGNGPQGTGLYRCRDTQGKDKIDDVKLLHKFKGGMGEHGPHAIIHGPDDWLYLVVGNHAWVQTDELAKNSPLTRWPTGGMGLDQGKPGNTEDVLLPRLNDARGHAANILAPGGTIWRLDHEGKNMSLVAAGFRNHYDAAFNPAGELFTFDSDMEWDENLPWYRAVRVCHCPPGADFVWRTGAANTPDYYIDSLPPVAETGRGSPVGVEFYDHTAFPKKYRGAFFMADWSIGTIFAVHLERDGASYKAKHERFCSGAPMNVTDLAVGPDGAIYFTMGGRNTQGGVYRIVATGEKEPADPDRPVQPLAPWSRGKGDAKVPTAQEVRALLLDTKVETLARGLWLAGVHGYKELADDMLPALKDGDALVRRRACEALLRAGAEVPVPMIWPMLGDKDRFVRHAARLVLERIPPKQWADRIAKEPNDLVAWNGIVALCHMNKATPYVQPIFARLRGVPLGKVDPQTQLDYLRTLQLALIHTGPRPVWLREIGVACDRLFPHQDWRVNRELAVVLTGLQLEKQLERPVQGKLVQALVAAKEDKQQQIHYAYCLRLLRDGWTAADKVQLATWYDGTKTWKGGHSFTPFLENIFRETLLAYNLEDRRTILGRGVETPQATLVLAQRLALEPQPGLLDELAALQAALAKTPAKHRGPELVQAVNDALTRAVIQKPAAEHLPRLAAALGSANPVLRGEALAALAKLEAKPKADDPLPYRALLVATAKLDAGQQWQAVEVLRRWSGRDFGMKKDKAAAELKSFAVWFGQSFSKEPALPNVGTPPAGESKYKMADLLAFLEKGEGKSGDVKRGRVVFEKANCFKCHKFGKEGEGVGPDLTALSKRFKRADTLEALVYPSKVISDQYRSVLITLQNGQQLNGLAAVQGDTVSVLLNDGTKVSVKKGDIDTQTASLISVMPERLLDALTLQEIADLFAYMESDPTKQ